MLRYVHYAFPPVEALLVPNNYPRVHCKAYGVHHTGYTDHSVWLEVSLVLPSLKSNIHGAGSI